MTELITAQFSDKEPRGLCYSHFGNRAAIGIFLFMYGTIFHWALRLGIMIFSKSARYVEIIT